MCYVTSDTSIIITSSRERCFLTACNLQGKYNSILFSSQFSLCVAGYSFVKLVRKIECCTASEMKNIHNHIVQTYFQCLKLRFKTMSKFYAVLTLDRASPTAKSLTMCAVPGSWLLTSNTLAYPPTAALVVNGMVRCGSAPPTSWDKFGYANKKKFNAEAEEYVKKNEVVESDADSR